MEVYLTCKCSQSFEVWKINFVVKTDWIGTFLWTDCQLVPIRSPGWAALNLQISNLDCNLLISYQDAANVCKQHGHTSAMSKRANIVDLIFLDVIEICWYNIGVFHSILAKFILHKLVKLKQTLASSLKNTKVYEYLVERNTVNTKFYNVCKGMQN